MTFFFFCFLVTPCYLPEFFTLWQDCSEILTSRLVNALSSKWPELNFAVFLKICTKLLGCNGRGQELERAVVSHLHSYCGVVQQHCQDVFTLKIVTKLCFKVVKMVAASDEETLESRVEVSHAVLSLLETALLQEVVRGVAKWEPSENQGEETIAIEKSVARSSLILLMNYASILSEPGKCNKKLFFFI